MTYHLYASGYRLPGPVNILLTRTKDQIDKHSLEIAQADEEMYSNMQGLADELPDHSPRYILLSYPLTLVQTPLEAFIIS